MTLLATSIAARKNLVEWEIKIFPIKRIIAKAVDKLLQRYINNLVAELDETHIEIENALISIKNHSKQDAQQDLLLVQNAIEVFARFDSRLFKTDYLNNKDVESRMQLVISKIYRMELELKKKAFAGESLVPISKDLADAITAKSKETLTKKLSEEE